MLFDSHAHINNDTFSNEEREALISDIEASDLSYVMDIGFDLQSSLLAVKHASELPWCYAAVGVHPHDAKTMDEAMLETIRELAAKDKVQAIGEIGLDFYYNHSDQDVQEYWFRRQIQLANELKMPIVIHSREADQKTMDILKEEGAFTDERKSWFPMRKGAGGVLEKDARVLLHCFSGSRELGQQYVKLGATLSIAGPVTYKNNRKTTEVVEAIPLEYLLVETDSPYLTPVPFRGKKNKPPYVEHTARRVALIKGVEYEEVAKVTLENAKVFFNIND
ncbi:MAG: TatD family hydrolase [Firmicutes bacterium]|nr:TatD family hydrolase [Bacillota bacterium]